MTQCIVLSPFLGSTGHINSVPVMTTSHHQATHQLTEFPRESHVQSYAQTDNESDEELDIPVSHQPDNGLGTDCEMDVPTNLLPQSSDIELRRRSYEDVEKSPRKNRFVCLFVWPEPCLL